MILSVIKKKDGYIGHWLFLIVFIRTSSCLSVILTVADENIQVRLNTLQSYQSYNIYLVHDCTHRYYPKEDQN